MAFGTDDHYLQYCFLAFIMFPVSFSLILVSTSEINIMTKIHLRKKYLIGLHILGHSP